MAQVIGQRVSTIGGSETMYRLSRPLADVAPDWSNVVVAVRPDGERSIYRGWGYEKADGTWSAVPLGNWRACFSPLTPRDLAFAEGEIALAGEG